MTKTQELNLLKFAAVCMAAFYLYRLTKAQGGTLQGKINSGKIANLGSQLLPEELRPTARKYGTALINKLIQ